ncbi:TetR/AcrR family transcriptional regulator [Nonomuraea sp. NPDC050536]|uniref:TetR/AcrR family transcriptional regulator n=1 Tax=Nonomuraea sp. NPDC050536 TaxID=3364366 RepID=UPI0037C930EB
MPTRSDALRNSGRIARAAIEALREQGPEVSLEEVARRAGVGIATVYRRFGDRDTLVGAAFEAYFAEEIEPLAQAARQAADPWEGLCAALTATVATLATHRSLLAAARESHALSIDIALRFLAPLGEALTAAQRLGRARADLEPRDLAAIVIMALATDDHTRYLPLLLDAIRPRS